MSLNWIGLIAALATFSGIWIGHVTVRKVDYVSSSVWLPSIVALAIGILLEVIALVSSNPYHSTALGIVGITVLWDGLEFWRQHHRIIRGHAPANPDNPRHQRILAENSSATTIDWLARNPTGRAISVEEMSKTGV
ncbi:MAG: DUF4491 family protein [Anaerolineales bacterium]|nr:DUF4491 family protein [Anaerolineales bacterium]